MSTPAPTTTITTTTSPLLYSYLGGGHGSNRVESVFGMSIPRVIFSIINNTATVVIAIVVMFLSRNETPNVPLRAWVVVYSIMCLLGPFLQCIEYRRLRQIGAQSSEFACGIMTTVLTIMSIFYVFWWVLGYNWISSGGKVLAEDAPTLYWFTAIFLALEAIFFLVSIVTSCIKRIFSQ